MAGDHVAPPGFLDVPLQLDAQRAVVPEAVEAAVDFARLKEKAAPFAQRDQFFHVHDDSSRVQGSRFKVQVDRLETWNLKLEPISVPV